MADPTPGDMLALEQLHTIDRGIVDLTGIEHATNLWLAELRYNRISDVSLLSSFTNLDSLVLSVNQISDVSPLSSLTNLTFLAVGDQVNDISALAGLTNLVHLSLERNLIKRQHSRTDTRYAQIPQFRSQGRPMI